MNRRVEVGLIYPLTRPGREPNSPTARVGGEPMVGEFRTVVHDPPMLSIENAYSIEELREQVRRSPHHRFPAAIERADQIRGMLTLKDLWRDDVHTTADLAKHLAQPLVVPVGASALSLLQRFRESRNHLGIVIDEFGGVEGLVTPTDIFEALVGELPEAGENYEPSMIKRADGSWSVDAAVDLEEFKTRSAIVSLPDQKEEFQTLAGYLITHAGRIPRLGDVLTVGEYDFEIIDVDGRRIDRILVSRKAV